jgi:hypothetical protein
MLSASRTGANRAEQSSSRPPHRFGRTMLVTDSQRHETSGVAVIALELIGVPFDSYARSDAVATAPAVLRAEGLVDRLRQVRAVQDVSSG